MRITVEIPEAVALSWRDQARKQGMTVGTWLRWRTDTLALAEPSLGDRIQRALAGRDMPAGDIPRMAKALGVKAASIRGALGSLVAKKRLRLDGGTYHQINGGE